MVSKRFLIVNGDDFGASQGINRGIMEAHYRGILTSTSLMVEMPGAEEAARMRLDAPGMSVGLHVVFTTEEGNPLIDFESAEECRTGLNRQVDRFFALIGNLPSHLDAHHNIYRDQRLNPIFLEAAKRIKIPLREHSLVKYFSEFYGQWNGETHLEQISVENLQKMLCEKIRGQFTELSCHPGYVEPAYRTSYSFERETELKTLCSPVIQETIDALGIGLMNYWNLEDFVSRSSG